MAEFSITSQVLTSSTAVMRMAGDMAEASFPQLEEAFHQALESGVIGLVLDTSALDSLTSAGLGAIINLSHLLEDRKGKLVLAAPRPKIQGLVEMLGIQEALSITETPEQAKKIVAALKA